MLDHFYQTPHLPPTTGTQSRDDAAVAEPRGESLVRSLHLARVDAKAGERATIGTQTAQCTRERLFGGKRFDGDVYPTTG